MKVTAPNWDLQQRANHFCDSHVKSPSPSNLSFLFALVSAMRTPSGSYGGSTRIKPGRKIPFVLRGGGECSAGKGGFSRGGRILRHTRTTGLRAIIKTASPLTSDCLIRISNEIHAFQMHTPGVLATFHDALPIKTRRPSRNQKGKSFYEFSYNRSAGATEHENGRSISQTPSAVVFSPNTGGRPKSIHWLQGSSTANSEVRPSRLGGPDLAVFTCYYAAGFFSPQPYHTPLCRLSSSQASVGFSLTVKALALSAGSLL